jgi:hypothetical protein
MRYYENQRYYPPASYCNRAICYGHCHYCCFFRDEQTDWITEERDNGFNISNDLVLKVPQNMLRSSQRLNNPDAFEQELLNHPLVTGITQSGRGRAKRLSATTDDMLLPGSA